ncbi:hypothetical protein HUJ05_013269 [Dendroctonus ponderosae]|nr:hypothetical protein HUJ05_013269 [Dendroctonus ponderosae]
MAEVNPDVTSASTRRMRIKLSSPAMESITTTNIGGSIKVLMPRLNETFNIDSVLTCGVYLEDHLMNMMDDIPPIVQH